MQIGIIGAGISGLACAFRLSELKKNGFDTIGITVLEKTGRVGGSIHTVTTDEGFTVEAGPNGFLDSKPHAVKLFRDAGLSHDLLKANPAAAKRFIMKNGQLKRLPENPPMFFKTELITLTGKLRLMAELFIPGKKDDTDETIASFARRRLGPQALDYFISPMVSGVFAGDPEKMSLKSSFRVIYDMEKTYGGLFRAMLKKKKKKKGAGPAGPGGVLTSYKGGLYRAMLDLSHRCDGVSFRHNVDITGVSRKDELFKVETTGGTFSFDILISAAPAHASGEFLAPLDAELAETLASIPYAPAFMCGIGYDAADIQHDLDGFGYLIPAVEKREILGALWTSSIFPERAPDGTKLVRVITGGDRMRHLMQRTDEELVDTCIREITPQLGITGKPRSVQYFRWEKAIPQYYVGHDEALARINGRTEMIPGLFLAGNYLTGVALNDCARLADEVIAGVRARLENRTAD